MTDKNPSFSILTSKPCEGCKDIADDGGGSNTAQTPPILYLSDESFPYTDSQGNTYNDLSEALAFYQSVASQYNTTWGAWTTTLQENGYSCVENFTLSAKTGTWEEADSQTPSTGTNPVAVWLENSSGEKSTARISAKCCDDFSNLVPPYDTNPINGPQPDPGSTISVPSNIYSCIPPIPTVCDKPTDWQITDDQNNVYAKGDILPTDPPEMQNVPDPFIPNFYYNTNLDMKLEILGCGNSAQVAETWLMSIDLCDPNSRYPSHGLAGSYAPQPPCDCEYNVETGDPIDPCIPCPNIIIGTTGTGQEWINPQPGVGVKFTAAVDNEWTNLANWQDANGNSPVSELPGGGTNVSIEANVTSTAVAISVGELTIQAGVEFSVAASAADLHCYGAIERNGDCGDGVGVVTVSGEAFVYGGGRNNGEIVNALVKFSGDGLNATLGVVTGDARFDDTSRNNGTITDDAEFYDTTENHGTVQGDGLFDGLPATNWGTVSGNGTFASGASNSGTVALDATFGGSSDNVATVAGNATFNASAVNSGTVSLDATFNGSASNASIYGPGTVVGNATFNGSSTNGFAPDSASGFVGGNATFNDTSSNATGSVAGNATFNDDTVNRAVVTNTATFNDCSYNWTGEEVGGTAGTFVPNPPPSAYPC
jgi:hypothetical protein